MIFMKIIDDVINKITTNFKHIKTEWEDNKDIFFSKIYWDWKRPFHSIINTKREANEYLPYCTAHLVDVPFFIYYCFTVIFLW